MKNIVRLISAPNAYLTAILAVTFWQSFAKKQIADVKKLSNLLLNKYQVIPNITYNEVNNYQVKLDVYQAKNSNLNPVVIFIHGGGWVWGNKETIQLDLLPYLEMGFSVVNVEYRLGSKYLAPAAVEDCQLALKWVKENAAKYNLDGDKIILTGHSAGGHLALTTGGMCEGNEKIKVAAIINWFGITDVNDLLSGENQRDYTVIWLGSQANSEEIARKVSPINYISSNLPPILTIHGDADASVPYTHAVRLHQKLNEVGVVNELVTIPGGGHGNFTVEEKKQIYERIREFLRQKCAILPLDF